MAEYFQHINTRDGLSSVRFHFRVPRKLAFHGVAKTYNIQRVFDKCFEWQKMTGRLESLHQFKRSMRPFV